MLALGKRPRDVAILIQKEHKEPPFLSFNTLKKYSQAYRYFFISPLETLKANVDNRTEGLPSIVDWKLNGLLGKIQEIEDLEKVVKVQLKRIDEQVKRENDLGLTFPGIRHEMLAFKNMISDLLQMKIELGYPGYERVPHRVDLRGQVLTARIDSLSPEDRQQLVEFGRTLFQMIDMTRIKGSHGSPPEQSLSQ